MIVNLDQLVEEQHFDSLEIKYDNSDKSLPWQATVNGDKIIRNATAHIMVLWLSNWSDSIMTEHTTVEAQEYEREQQ